MRTYLCIDIGGTSIKYGIYDEKNGFLTDGSVPTNARQGGPALMRYVIGLAGRLLAAYDSVCGICISTAGMVDCGAGTISYASSLIPDYTGTPVRRLMEDAFGLPCEVENDVNCAGLAEYHCGAARHASSCLCLTVGTGIGGAFLQNGTILRGFSGSGCEVGYMRLPGGEFQELASATALVRYASSKKAVPPSSLSGKKIFELAKGGDADCMEAIDRMASFLGMGIANLCYVLNPEIVVLGGGIMVQKDVLYGKIKASLDSCLLPSIARYTTLTFAQNQNRAGMLGAYYHFRTRKKD